MTMLKFLPYVRKNILGHRVRTAMTVAGTALLLFLFLFVTAIQGGLDRVLGARGSDRPLTSATAQNTL